MPLQTKCVRIKFVVDYESRGLQNEHCVTGDLHFISRYIQTECAINAVCAHRN